MGERYPITEPVIREALAEKLKKELDDLYVRSVLKPTKGTDYALGVGTPYLVEIQDEGIGPYILFTGWNTSDGSRREVFIGEIDEDFKISNVRKLIAVGEPTADYTSHDAVHALYNPFGGWWWVFTPGYYPATGLHRICAWRYSKDFSERLSVHHPLADKNGVVFEAADSGFSGVRGLDRRASFCFVRAFSPTDLRLWGTVTADINTIPPSFEPGSRLYPKGIKDAPGYGDYVTSNPDALQIVPGREWFTVLAEDFSHTTWPEQYNIFPYFIFPSYEALSTGRLGLALRAPEGILQPFGSHGALNIGHPHLSWLPNHKLNLFFAMFPSCWPSYKHEIWVVRLPQERLNPKSYRYLTCYPWFKDSIAVNEESLPFPGWGKKTIIFHSDTSGDLTILVDYTGLGDWDTFATISGVTSTQYQTTYSARAFKLRFSAAATVTAQVIIEP
jgi:hypothetical protein